MKNKTKRGLFWYLLFALIFLLYCDFCSWERFEVLIGGWLPTWFLYLMTLIVVYSLLAFFFTKKHWPPPPSDLSGPPEGEKSYERERSGR